MMTRDEMRKIGIELTAAVFGRHDDALVDMRAKVLRKAADIIATPTWFSANELRLAADAMDLLGYSSADGWTLRARLDAFWKNGPILKNAGSFAAYLQNQPNGGVQ